MNTGAVASLIGLTISGNSSDFGGGIINNGTLTVSNSTFSQNEVVFSGGGIATAGTLTVSNSTFSGNMAASAGGGIFKSGGTLTVK